MVDRQLPRHALSPSISISPRRPDEGHINEKILNLVTALSDRVRCLEAKTDDGVDARKRLLPEEDHVPLRPPKQARFTHAESIWSDRPSDNANDANNTETNSVKYSSMRRLKTLPQF